MNTAAPSSQRNAASPAGGVFGIRLISLIALSVLLALLVFWLNRGRVEVRERTEDLDMIDIAAQQQQPQPQQQEAPTSAPSPSDIVDIATFDPNATSFSVSLPTPNNAPRGPTIPQTSGSRSDPYAAAIEAIIRRHLRRDEALRQEMFTFKISVFVTSAATIEVRNIWDIRPPELRDEITRALIGVGPATSPPPSTTINPINLQYQSG